MTALQETTTAVLLPHELFASLYEFQGGHLFFTNLIGLPQDLSSTVRHVMLQDVEEYWRHNSDLWDSLLEYWGPEACSTLCFCESCRPLMRCSTPFPYVCMEIVRRLSVRISNGLQCGIELPRPSNV